MLSLQINKMRNEVRFLFKQRFVALAIVGVVLTGFGCQQNATVQSEVSKQEKITTMYQEYAREFSEVKGITVRELQQLQQQGEKIVLVDVRSPKERAVSIIPGAISIQEFETNIEQFNQNNSTVVAYCTIGYRSGKYAKKLRKKGINILNLEGSLLAWSHIQGELVNATGSTKKVHVFGRQWQLTADNYQPVW